MTITDKSGLTTADLASVSPKPDSQDPKNSTPHTGASPVEGQAEAVFSQDDVNHLRPMWTEIQANFIAEPRKSVEEADSLVAATIKRLAESFANERVKLESQWLNGGDVSTEELRLALRRYRSFFDRLLST
jgi:hypothetical protein